MKFLKIEQTKKWFFIILSYFFPYTAVIIFILFAFAFVSTAVSAFSLSWDHSNDGFKWFFEIYSSSIQLGAAFLALTAITLTLERMRQSKDQIEMISSNNRFNNYYHHLDKFVEDISTDRVILKLDGKPRVDKDLMVKNLYFQFFYNSYENFSPVFNQNVLKQKTYVKVLLDGICAAPIYRLTDLDRDQLSSIISNLEKNKFIEIITPFVDDLVNSFGDVEVRIRVKAALYLYYSIHFYKIVLSREGENLNLVRKYENQNFAGKVMNISADYLMNLNIGADYGIIKV